MTSRHSMCAHALASVAAATPGRWPVLVAAVLTAFLLTGDAKAQAQALSAEEAPQVVSEAAVEDSDGLSLQPGRITWRHRAADADFTLRPFGIIAVNSVFNSGVPFPTAEAPTGAALGSGLDDRMPGQGGFTLSARQSRFGLESGYEWGEHGIATTKLEFDLWGIAETNGPGTATHTGVRLRHASLRIGNDRVRFLAGQDWAVVTPRLPTSLGHMAVALHTFSGAVWHRLPQIGIEVDTPLGESSSFLTRVSLVRAQSGDGPAGFSRFDGLDPGARGQLPWLQGRVALQAEFVEVGVAGHIGRERYDVATGTDMSPGYRHGELIYKEVDVPTWMGSFDLRVEAGPLWLHGQVWTGANLNGMFSRHGVYRDYWDADDVFADGALAGELKDVEAVRGYGGWAELGVHLNECFRLVGSVGGESGEKNDVDYGDVYQNLGYFGGIIWKPLAWFDASLEYVHSATYFRPELGYRDDPNYRVADDPLRGNAPPTRQRQGHNDSISLNVRLQF